MSVVELPASFALRALVGFLAGFVGTLLVHQPVVYALIQAGLDPFPAFSLQPTSPWGTPLVINLAFWAGVWAIAYVFLAARLPRRINMLLAGAAFGILFPTLASWTVIAVIKGHPLFFAYNWRPITVAVIANSLWGASLPVLSTWGTRLLGVGAGK